MAMRIEPHTIRLAELFEGYRNDGENGAVAYGGRLICRPPYQREFVYKPKQQEEVVNTILKGLVGRSSLPPLTQNVLNENDTPQK